MWDEGIYIYGTPGVSNNFPLNGKYNQHNINILKYIHIYA